MARPRRSRPRRPVAIPGRTGGDSASSPSPPEFGQPHSSIEDSPVTKALVSAPWQRALIILTTTVVGAIVVSLLYWAQVVFMPLALAVFLTFLLSAPVQALQRRGLGRASAIFFVITVAGL